METIVKTVAYLPATLLYLATRFGCFVAWPMLLGDKLSAEKTSSPYGMDWILIGITTQFLWLSFLVLSTAAIVIVGTGT